MSEHTFYRNGDKLDAWELVHYGYGYIDFQQGDYTRFTVVCEGNEPSSGYIMFNWSLTIEGEDWQERTVSLSDPCYSEFADWAKQIIKKKAEEVVA